MTSKKQAKTALNEMSTKELKAYYRILLMGSFMLMSREDRKNNELHYDVVTELLRERGIEVVRAS
jgi:hypothetical protein